ncbi:ABC transporter permease [Azospirillum soli]|uniref:ABC transporter permease n=1 Tax=Azospirillum soli TaxID=1304799 RepID=UPI001AE1C683|nr:ABC transporter permease [Azospirillum soli]MBP2316908.1 putative ABC transport system permease protein [Azospirillum soli]
MLDLSGRSTHLGTGLLGTLAAEAVGNLRAMRQRSLLALLGIVIGTAAVIAMVAIGETAKQQALGQFKAMGTDLLAVHQDSAQPGRLTPFTPGDAAALRDRPEIDAVAPLAIAGVEIAHGRSRVTASVAGVTADLPPVARLRVAEGRFLSAFDEGQTFAVLGAGVARRLGEEGRPPAVGDVVRMGGYGYTVIGVLEETVANPLLPVDLNGAAFVPLAGLRRIAPAAGITTLIARMAPGVGDEAARQAAVTHFAQPHATGPRARPVVVQSARQLIAAMAEQMQVYTLLLSAIGAISLVVGGVGVMNVMLMSVVERRREIGVQLAVGARPRDIRAMFLVEALALSLAGGALGTALGTAAAAFYAQTAGWPFALPAVALPLGLGMSVAVGLFFGLYPAVRAARLDPIQALRGE